MSAKSIMKKVAKPLASPLTRRVNGRVDLRAAELHRDLETYRVHLDAQTAALSADVEALNRYLPVVLNVIASQNAARRETERRLHAIISQLEALDTRLSNLEIGVGGHADAILEIRDRIEFVRREILLEQRYESPHQGDRPMNDHPIRGTEAGTSASGPRIVNEKKFWRMTGNLRVNVGAGHVLREDYLNLDSRELPGIDIVADVRDLPFAEEELKEIYCAHLLEHFPAEELRKVILPRWVPLLEDGGKLTVVVPDVKTMAEEFVAGTMPFEDFIEVMYGGQEYDGDFHFNGFSRESLTAIFEEMGLGDVKVIEEGRPNGICLEMEMEAVRRISAAP